MYVYTVKSIGHVSTFHNSQTFSMGKSLYKAQSDLESFDQSRVAVNTPTYLNITIIMQDYTTTSSNLHSSELVVGTISTPVIIYSWPGQRRQFSESQLVTGK